ncbi:MULTISPECIES: aldolase catalytic domain-containing protein [unclassified Dehalobacter]|uniref:aldolase catalytic domain-containing protein n=1 Tax=unclassified Dehalobacter TaxID=2635733 RepID=UPI000E6D4EFB|nr:MULTISPECIES: aldolase catalytic domain-containing protein [unclassified Dehalobacter]RJE48438.1 4-hydroxy-2-oxovalerate aldolase [Dehalobacter sp. MCB1]TCX50506.1 4-hydroxy-2-oxovalerate aldolase [Dehalobacter sp. 14DCB1]TCX52254.1 4-hydroxy-2-oxovalerate aldolase [Dehalobacter sp. 12DCB1]
MRKLTILDCTLRDGGLTNNFQFPELYMKDHIQRISEAKVDYLELGYKTDPAFCDRTAYGKLKFCDDNEIRDLIAGIPNLPKLAFMVDVGRFDRRSVENASVSPFAMGRVACYLDQIEEAVEDVRFLQNKGYETTLNIMAISRENISEIVCGLRKIKTQIPAEAVYVVDSYGALYPDDVKKLVSLYKKELDGMNVGIHVHNNMQLAFSNTITAIESGASFLDASVNGMGRGAGNCPLECLLPYAGKDHYDLKPVLALINDYYIHDGDERSWGYCPKQLLTGIFNQHPVYSIQGAGEDLIRIYDHFQSEVQV